METTVSPASLLRASRAMVGINLSALLKPLLKPLTQIEAAVAVVFKHSFRFFLIYFIFFLLCFLNPCVSVSTFTSYSTGVSGCV